MSRADGWYNAITARSLPLIIAATIVCCVIYVEISRTSQSAGITAGTQAPTVARVALLTNEIIDLRKQLRSTRNETNLLQLKWNTERNELMREAELLQLQLNHNEATEWSRDHELAYRLTRLEAKLGITEPIPSMTPTTTTSVTRRRRSSTDAYLPGFDWGTPQSRPALEQRLADYTKYHHDAIHGDLAQHKYLVFKPEGSGLGNRVTSMASAFLTALLLNRIFLVHWQSPSPMSTQLVSNVLELDPRPLMPALSRLTSEHINWQLDQNTPLCANLEESLPQQVVYMTGTGQHFACFIANNEHFRAEVNRLFSASADIPLLSKLGFEGPSHGQVFAPLERYLVRPISQLQRRVITLTTPFTGKFVVGMQVRVGITRLAASSEMPEELLRQLWVACRGVAEAHYANDTSQMIHARYFIAADQERVYASAKAFFGNQLLYNPDDYSDEWRAATDDAAKTARLIKAEQDGVVVNWALSRANAMVYTSVSSFGQMAAARMAWLDSSRDVYEFVIRHGGSKINLIQRRTREPICNHWDKASCGNRHQHVWTWRTGWTAA